MKQSDFEIAGEMVQPGSFRRLELPVARLPTGTWMSLPIAVTHGVKPGPTLWINAAIHGDELNGVEIVGRVLRMLDPRELSGTVIAVPIVNVFGFVFESRYLPDRRDLNRSFPGAENGSLAGRLAQLFMHEVVGRCQYGLDLHTGSDFRANLPQIRCDLDDAETRRIARAFGAPVVLHAERRPGSLRAEATRAGVRVLVYEAGEQLRFDESAARIGVRGVFGVLEALEMHARLERMPAPLLETRRARWVRARQAGLCHLSVRLGDSVDKNEELARITDTFGQESAGLDSPCAGLVIGCLTNPLVHRGDAVVRVATAEEN